MDGMRIACGGLESIMIPVCDGAPNTWPRVTPSLDGVNIARLLVVVKRRQVVSRTPLCSPHLVQVLAKSCMD